MVTKLGFRLTINRIALSDCMKPLHASLTPRYYTREMLERMVCYLNFSDPTYETVWRRPTYVLDQKPLTC